MISVYLLLDCSRNHVRNQKTYLQIHFLSRQYPKGSYFYAPIRVKVQSLSHTKTCSFVLVLKPVYLNRIIQFVTMH